MNSTFTVNENDLVKYVTHQRLEPVPVTHQLATFGDTNVVLYVGGVYDSDESNELAITLVPLEHETVRVACDGGKFEMHFYDLSISSAVAGMVGWRAEFVGAEEKLQ